VTRNRRPVVLERYETAAVGSTVAIDDFDTATIVAELTA
jgi:hypothetical protein